MVDIETAGLPPTGALLSIGAVFFDLRSGAIGPRYEATIHLGSAVADGGTIDASTFLWWLGQSEKARNSVRFGGRHLHTVLDEFAEWIAKTCRPEDVRVWGNSPSFDMVILGGAYKRAGKKVPWHWTKERDFRTVRAMYPQIEYDVKEEGDDAHSAVEDALFQIRHLMKIRNRNKERACT